MTNAFLVDKNGQPVVGSATAVDATSGVVALTAQTAPTVETADRPLMAADGSRTLTCASARAFTVPAGMLPNFGPGFYGAGAVTVTGQAGVTVNDDRSAGGTSPFMASLIMIGVDTFSLRGSKA